MPTSRPPTRKQRWVTAHQGALRVFATLYAVTTMAYGLYTALNGEPLSGWWFVATGLVVGATLWVSTRDAARQVAEYDEQQTEHP